MKRGEKIKIIANPDCISASMPGEALEKGSEGWGGDEHVLIAIKHM
ncbi:hypothetical protein D0C16_10115 [Cellvibrio sp. KY-GH-1]|nr:hypothetical protein D0C16_10115 [Cellvibrio sp. KY-GH-1]